VQHVLRKLPDSERLHTSSGFKCQWGIISMHKPRLRSRLRLQCVWARLVGPGWLGQVGWVRLAQHRHTGHNHRQAILVLPPLSSCLPKPYSHNVPKLP
jgi:hypothetical protein